MATLSTQADGELDPENGSPQLSADKQELGWHWRTWTTDLRRAIITAVVMLLVLGGLVYFLNSQAEDFAKALSVQNGLKAQAQTKLRESDTEKATLIKNLPLLHDLQARNIFGDEKRLEWVEQLRAIEKRWPGLSIKFDISSQKVLPKAGAPAGPQPPVPAGAKLPNGEPVKNFAVFSTDMRLTLHLLHEGDALAIFDELRQAKLGLFSVHDCRLKRVDTGRAASAANKDDFGAPTDANCLLVWTSMNTYAP